MQEARAQLALLRFARLIVSQLGSISSLRLIPTIHSFSSLRVQRNAHGALANPDLSQAMAPSKQKRTHAVFRGPSAHRSASTSKPRFVGEKVKLGELISKAKVERCGDRPFPVYSMTMHDGIVEQSGRFKKTIASRDTSSYKVVKKNQLVVGFPIDEGVIYVQNHDQPGIMSPAYNVWDFDSDRILPAYLEFVLHSPQSMAYYAEKMRGTTARRRTLTGDALKNMPVPVPSIEDQYAVVKTLNCIKSQLAATQQMLDKLDQLVKSRFVEMFGDPTNNEFDFPVEKLGGLGLLERGKSKHRPRNAPELRGGPNGPYPLIQTGDIANAGTYLATYEDTYTELGLLQSRIWPKGTLCITIAANIAKTSILAIDACFPDSVVGFTTNGKVTNLLCITGSAFSRAFSRNRHLKQRRRISTCEYFKTLTLSLLLSLSNRSSPTSSRRSTNRGLFGIMR